VNPLLQAIQKPNLGVYGGFELAIEVLGQLGDRRAVEPLISILAWSSVHTRLAIVKALGQLGDAVAIQALLETFRAEITDEETDAEIFFETGRVLGGLGSAAFEPLMKALADKDTNVRAGTANALGYLGDKRAVKGLVGILTDPDRQVRLEAIAALGKLGDQSATQPLLKACLPEQESIIRIYAIRALGNLGNPDALRTLTNALRDSTLDVHLAAIYALGDLGNSQAYDLLVNEIHNPEPEIRCATALALGKIGNKQALPLLEQMRLHDDGKTRVGNKVRDYADAGIKRIQSHL